MLLSRGAMRPITLRRIYEALHVSGINGAELSRLELSFDDYFEFLHALAPAVSRRAAAERSGRTDFRQLAATMPADPPRVDAAPPRWTSFDGKKTVELTKLRLDRGSTHLRLERVKNVRGWHRWRGLRTLETLQVLGCDTTELTSAAKPIRIRAIDVDHSSSACLRALLGSVDAEELTVGSETDPVSLSWLATCRSLRRMRISAPLVRGVSSLIGAPLQSLALGEVSIDDVLRGTLQTFASTLEDLRLDSAQAFLPDELGAITKFKALRSVTVPAFPELRRQWVDFAVSNPRIAFDFFTVQPHEPKGEQLSIEEEYRGVEIVKCVKGPKTAYEVADDLAERKGSEGSNEDLEDLLRPIAKAAKKKIDWRSEADTFVARTSDVATARWLIDAALDERRDNGTPKPQPLTKAGPTSTTRKR